MRDMTSTGRTHRPLLAGLSGAPMGAGLLNAKPFNCEWSTIKSSTRERLTLEQSSLEPFRVEQFSFESFKIEWLPHEQTRLQPLTGKPFTDGRLRRELWNARQSSVQLSRARTCVTYMRAHVPNDINVHIINYALYKCLGTKTRQLAARDYELTIHYLNDRAAAVRTTKAGIAFDTTDSLHYWVEDLPCFPLREGDDFDNWLLGKESRYGHFYEAVLLFVRTFQA